MSPASQVDSLPTGPSRSQTELLWLHVKHYYKHLPFSFKSLNTSMWYCFQFPDILADDAEFVNNREW